MSWEVVYHWSLVMDSVDQSKGSWMQFRKEVAYVLILWTFDIPDTQESHHMQQLPALESLEIEHVSS